jgi:hypothetical protein
MITDEQVRDAITILHAFAAGEITIADALAVELIDAAIDVVSMPGVTAIICTSNDHPTPPNITLSDRRY